MIEKVRVLRTLKAGPNVWHQGDIVGPPVPADLLGEIRRGWVEIVKESAPISVVEVPKEIETTSTSVGVSTIHASGSKRIPKPLAEILKPKLKSVTKPTKPKKRRMRK